MAYYEIVRGKYVYRVVNQGGKKKHHPVPDICKWDMHYRCHSIRYPHCRFDSLAQCLMQNQDENGKPNVAELLPFPVVKAKKNAISFARLQRLSWAQLMELKFPLDIRYRGEVMLKVHYTVPEQQPPKSGSRKKRRGSNVLQG